MSARRRRSWGTTSLVILVACEREAPRPEVADLAPGVPPFAELRGVHLGMRSRELIERRPRVVHAPYTGWVESVGPDTVYYTVDRPSLNESVPPRGRTRLVAVSAYRTFASDSLAIAAWQSRVALLWPGALGPSRCYRLQVPISGGQGAAVVANVAVGERSGAELSTLYKPGERGFHALGPVYLPPRVRVTLAAGTDSTFTRSPMLTAAPCPDR